MKKQFLTRFFAKAIAFRRFNCCVLVSGFLLLTSSVLLAEKVNPSDWNWQPLRLEKSGQGNGWLVSLADLTHWRSPRGLNYTLSGGKIFLVPQDKSGYLAIRLASGRVLDGTGCFSNLGHQSLDRVTGRHGDQSFFTLDREDFLINLGSLRAYFGDYGRPTAKGGFQIACGPKVIGPDNRYFGEKFSHSTTLDMPPWTFSDNQLNFTIYGSRTQVQYPNRLVSVMNYTIYFLNRTKEAVVIQPARFSVYSETEVSAVSLIPQYTPYGPWPGKVGFDGAFWGPGYLRGTSRILKSGARGTFTFTQVVFDIIQNYGYVKFNYSDGRREYEFTALLEAEPF